MPHKRKSKPSDPKTLAIDSDLEEVLGASEIRNLQQHEDFDLIDSKLSISDVCGALKLVAVPDRAKSRRFEMLDSNIDSLISPEE